MSDESKNQKPTFKRPEENQPPPITDQARYFAYWEAQRIERLKREREEDDGLSVYQRSWRPPPEWGW